LWGGVDKKRVIWITVLILLDCGTHTQKVEIGALFQHLEIFDYRAKNSQGILRVRETAAPPWKYSPKRPNAKTLDLPRETKRAVGYTEGESWGE